MHLTKAQSRPKLLCFPIFVHRREAAKSKRIKIQLLLTQDFGQCSAACGAGLAGESPWKFKAALQSFESDLRHGESTKALHGMPLTILRCKGHA